jgi:hypothetical protein
MNRTLWVAAAASVLVLCFGSLVLSTGSVSVSLNNESVYTTLCNIAPEYRFPTVPPLVERPARPFAHPA